MMKSTSNGGGGQRPLIVNADDYAMDDAVDMAILRLAELSTVTATSAMVLSPTWPEAARKLRDAPLSPGLHLDFTSPFVARDASLRTVMWGAFTRRLDANAIRSAIERQLTLYETAMGTAPQFIDGHQHVHQFPIIRDELLRVLLRRYGERAGLISVRSCVAKRWRGLKAALVAATGAAAFAGRAHAAGHSMNSDFAGVYDFSPAADLTALWRRWLANLQGGAPLVMCHVSETPEALTTNDPIRAARINEYQWLKSGAFASVMGGYGFAPALWRPQ